MTHEVIAEEQVEESAHATKRQSLENQHTEPNFGGVTVANAYPIVANAAKSLASASAPNLS